MAEFRGVILRNAVIAGIVFSLIIGGLFYATGNITVNTPSTSGSLTTFDTNISTQASITTVYLNHTSSSFLSSSCDSFNCASSTSTGEENTTMFTGETSILTQNSTFNSTTYSLNHTHSVVSTFSVGNNPYLFTFDPDNKMIYISELLDYTVTVINATDNTIVKSIPVGPRPTGLEYDPINHEVYVANSVANYISVINTTTNIVVSNITVDPGPQSILFNPSNQYLYVAHYNPNDSAGYGVSNSNGPSEVSVINGTNNKVLTTISVPGGPLRMAYDSNNQEVYVSLHLSSSVAVIKNESLIATIPIGCAPNGITYDQANGYVYAVNQCGNSVSVIDPESNNSVIATIGVGTSPYGIGYDPPTGEIFVSSTYGTNTVYIINGITVDDIVYVGPVPDGIIYNPINGYMYVDSAQDNNVWMICNNCSIVTTDTTMSETS